MLSALANEVVKPMASYFMRVRAEEKSQTDLLLVCLCTAFAIHVLNDKYTLFVCLLSRDL